MPTQGSLIQLKAGLHENYVAIENKDLNTIYFCTDTQQMFIGETEYTRPVISGSSLPTIDSPVNTLFYHTTEKALYSNIGGNWAKVSNDYTHPTSSAAGTFGEGDKTAEFGGTIKVPYLIVDNKGHVTGASSSTVTLPNLTTESYASSSPIYVNPTDDNLVVTSITVDNGVLTYHTNSINLPQVDLIANFSTSGDGKLKQYDIDGSTVIRELNLVENLPAATRNVQGVSDEDDTGLVTQLYVSQFQTMSQVQSAIDSAISGITQFDIQLVASFDKLPKTGKKGVIYLVPDTHSDSNDAYDEYIWNSAATTPAYEKIGNTDVNLSGYIPVVTGKTGQVPKFNADGKLESTGFTLGVSVPADAKFTDTVYTHPAGSAASKSSGLYKFATDATSHINSVTAVKKEDITALGIPAQDTTYSADRGISLVSGKFGHSNTAITAKTTATDTSKTLTWGGTLKVDTVKYDTLGHITGTDEITFTMPANPNTDTKVTNTLNTTAKAYITGTTSATTSTGTQVFDTGVYLDTTAGTLVATKFKGSLTGNADTATSASKATADADGNEIKATYATKAEVTAAALTWGSF